MPRVRVGDIDMYYVEAGAGEPLVLVMGFSGDHSAWGLQFHALAQRCRVEEPVLRPVGEGHVSACHLEQVPVAQVVPAAP